MFRIRPLGQQDLPFLSTWMPSSALETVPAADRHRVDPGGLQVSASELLQSVLSTPARHFSQVAEWSGQPVGYLLCGPSPDTTTGEMHGYLMDLFVLPELRRRGIGRALVLQALALFTAAGLRKAKLWGLVDNGAVLALAAGVGFKPEGLIGQKQW